MGNPPVLTAQNLSSETPQAIAIPQFFEVHPFCPRKTESSWVGSRGKRLFDLAFTALILPLAIPFFLLIPLVIVLESPGPIFFPHRRLGWQGSIFRMFKFRTMMDGADGILSKLLDSDPAARREFAINYKLKKDPRVTRLGRFLRRSSLDELPQILNVLKGEISWVGPRPIIESEIEKYGHQAAAFLRMKPGITGLWQAGGRSDLPYEERVRLDMQYLDHASLWLDLKIIFRTVRVVLKRNGAI
jgi:lipopolysaccharide/colanic/teichoic acid biosynthesis glycosyltransferase